LTKKNIVHVVGTGTIGEPLIGLFNEFKDAWGIDEVTFHKRTPNADDRAKVNQLISHGAKFAADDEARADFANLGHRVSYTAEEAIERATVVVDCTPAGNENKGKYYERLKGPRGFLAQAAQDAGIEEREVEARLRAVRLHAPRERCIRHEGLRRRTAGRQA
jgi:glyceraldehyde-3-phosphate dehydrogenase/erythrose-4-phosphate dehydrogenase